MANGDRLYKVLNEDGTPYNGGKGKWYLPKGGRPGKWMPAIRGELEACRNGYHLCSANQLINWLGPVIYEAEARGDRIEDTNKVVVRQARLLRRVEAWNRKAIRLLACDFAEHTIHFFEAKYPDDRRPRNAIEVARRFANGKATTEEFNNAGVAARAAIRAAWAEAIAWTGAAAEAVAWDAEAAAEAVAWAAWDTEAAAGTVAWAAWNTGVAAGMDEAAELNWQAQRLQEIILPQKDAHPDKAEIVS